jgi:hypothetical protein
MLRPNPSSRTLTGCWDTTRAPAQKSGADGPGIFEMVTFNGGLIQPAAVVIEITRAVRVSKARGNGGWPR